MAGGGVREAKLRMSLVDDVSATAKSIMATLKRLDRTVKSFNQAREAANTNFRNAALQAAAFSAALVVPVRAAAKLEDAMADLRKVTSLSDDQLTGLRKSFIDISKTSPMAADSVAELAASLAAAGIADKDLLEVTKLAQRAAIAFGLSTDEAGDSLAKIKTQLGLTVPELEHFTDAANALGNTTASKEKDLVEFAKRTGSMGKVAGFTADQILAIGSAQISAGAETELAATGFQAFVRATTAGVNATKKQQQAWKSIGLTAGGVSKSMSKNAMGAMLDIFQRLQKLPADKRFQTFNSLFGDEGRTMLPFIENLGLITQNLDTLADSAKIAGSAQKEFDTRIGTTSGKLAMLRNRAMAVAISFGSALLPSIRDTADALSPLLDRAGAFVDSNQEMVARLTKVTAGMIAARVAITGLKAGMLNLLRPTNLLIAGLGYLAYQSFDDIAGALRELQTAASQLASTQFGEGFIKGAREALEGMASSARELAGYLASISKEGSDLRAWLDSVAGANAGEMLGKVTVAFGALVASMALLGPVLRPLRSLVGLVAGLSRASGGVRAAASSLEAVNAAAMKAGTIKRPSIWSMLLAADSMIDVVDNIPKDSEEFKKFVDENYKRSEALNSWIEKNIGTPRSWLDNLTGGGKPKADPAKGARDELANVTKDWPAAARKAITSYGNALAEGGPQAEQEAAQIGERVKAALTVEGRPTVDTSDLERALGLARQIAQALRAGPAPSLPPASNLKFGGPRAKGGPVSSGSTYLVGEKGPELFTPKVSGSITPNHRVGGTMTVQMTNHFHVAPGASDSQAMEILNKLSHALARSRDTAFGTMKPWGD